MRLDRAVFVLLVLAQFFFALPGCVSQPGVPDRTMIGKESIASTPTATTSPAIATPTKPTVLTERRFWTKIEPIPDVKISENENITINGTTNLASGETISIEFFARSMHPSPMVYYPELHFSAGTEIRAGDEGINIWSVTIPTQNFKKPDQYSVEVVDQRGFSNCRWADNHSKPVIYTVNPIFFSHVSESNLMFSSIDSGLIFSIASNHRDTVSTLIH